MGLIPGLLALNSYQKWNKGLIPRPTFALVVGVYLFIAVPVVIAVTAASG